MTREALDHQSTHTPQACGVLPVASPFRDRDTLVYEMFLGPNNTLQVSPLVDSANNVVVKTHLEDVQHVLRELLDDEAHHVEYESELGVGQRVRPRLWALPAAQLSFYEPQVVHKRLRVGPSGVPDFYGAVIGSMLHRDSRCRAFVVLQYYKPTNRFSLVLHVLVDKRTLCEPVIRFAVYKEMMELAENHVRRRLINMEFPRYYSVGTFLQNNPIQFGPSTNAHLELPILGRYNHTKNVLTSAAWPKNVRRCLLCTDAAAVVVTGDCGHQYMCIGCTEKLVSPVCVYCRAQIAEWWVAPPPEEEQ